MLPSRHEPNWPSGCGTRIVLFGIYPVLPFTPPGSAPVVTSWDRHLLVLSLILLCREDMTQLGRARKELGIEILCTNSSQAKGRVERVNRTLQDRLVKELRIAGISTLEAANAYLPAFVARFNERFAIVPARSRDLHRPLECVPAQRDTFLAWREQCYVTHQLARSFDRKRIILEVTPLSVGLAGKYVETYEFPDGRAGATGQSHAFGPQACRRQSKDSTRRWKGSDIAAGCNASDEWMRHVLKQRPDLAR